MQPAGDDIGQLLAALEAEAEEEIARLDRRAHVEARAIVRSAEKEAEQIEREPVEAQAPALAGEVARRLAAARLEADREVGHAREAGFQDALAALRERLARLRDDPRYPDVFSALVGEALAALPAGTRLLVDPRDAELAGSVAGELTVEPALETWGGAVVASPDGRLARNTLEDRLANAEATLRIVVAHSAGALRAGVAG